MSLPGCMLLAMTGYRGEPLRQTLDLLMKSKT